ncbi:MAG TPA: hypothetical protein VH575_18630 [Gemmataceae bacterium]
MLRPFAVEGQERQGVEGASHVEELRVRVDAHRQVDLAVTHRGLCCPRSHSTLAQQRPEGMT